MSNRFEDIDEYTDPPIFERPSRSTWLAVFVVLALIAGAIALVHGAEAEKPELWIWTARFPEAPEFWCGPCNALHDDIESGALSGFTIHYLRPRGTVPCIAYWKDSRFTRAAYFKGWYRGAEKQFLTQWRRDAKR